MIYSSQMGPCTHIKYDIFIAIDANVEIKLLKKRESTCYNRIIYFFTSAISGRAHLKEVGV